MLRRGPAPRIQVVLRLHHRSDTAFLLCFFRCICTGTRLFLRVCVRCRSRVRLWAHGDSRSLSRCVPAIPHVTRPGNGSLQVGALGYVLGGGCDSRFHEVPGYSVDAGNHDRVDLRPQR